MRKLFVLGVSVCVAMAVAGCRGDDDDTSTDGGRRDSGMGADASVRNTTIQKIQMGMEPEGSIVSVVGAVVTAQKTRTCGTAMCFDVWVQEATGGMYSGVMLFGVPDHKRDDGQGLPAQLEPLRQAIVEAKSAAPALPLFADVCLCAYTTHGHCGLTKGEKILKGA